MAQKINKQIARAQGVAKCKQRRASVSPTAHVPKRKTKQHVTTKLACVTFQDRWPGTTKHSPDAMVCLVAHGDGARASRWYHSLSGTQVSRSGRCQCPCPEKAPRRALPAGWTARPQVSALRTPSANDGIPTAVAAPGRPVAARPLARSAAPPPARLAVPGRPAGAAQLPPVGRLISRQGQIIHNMGDGRQNLHHSVRCQLKRDKLFNFRD